MDILIVDDHAATREEIGDLLEGQDDLHVVGAADGGEEGIRLAAELRPDLIVMDVVMPETNGIAATKAVRDANPAIRIVALSNHTGGNLVKVLLSAGAAGYVRKDRAFEELVPAIRKVAAGEQYIGTHVED